MTEIFLNNVRVDFEIEGDDTDVGSCIAAFEGELNSCGHVITGIGADGEEVTEWSEIAFRSKLLSDIAELQILASPREELLSLGFEACLESTLLIRDDLKIALTKYRDDEYREATEALAKALNNAKDFMMTYDAIAASIPALEPPPGFTSLVESLGTLVGLFEDIKEAMDGGDVIAITDLIEYEAIPLVVSVGEELTLLSK